MPATPIPLTPLLVAALLAAIAIPASAQEGSAGASSQDLSNQLANPVSSLISVPFQFNYDDGLGTDGDASRYLLNIQPVVPISLNTDWTLITRVILPVVSLDSLFPGDGTESGLGDTLASFFFSPKKPTRGIIWGLGPAINLPTATESELGTGKWSAGPTAVVLTQQDGWTIGVLANHIWSFAGNDEREHVSQTFVQPFISYAWKSGFSLALNSEATYAWDVAETSIPLNLVASQIITIGGQNLQIFAGGRVYAESPEFGPDWGLRAGVTFLFPTK